MYSIDHRSIVKWKSTNASVFSRGEQFCSFSASVKERWLASSRYTADNDRTSQIYIYF